MTMTEQSAHKQATHAPTPWTIESLTGHYDTGVRAPNHGYVCFLSRTGPNPRRNSEAEANAHLIAAAPTMCEALEVIAKGGCENYHGTDCISAGRQVDAEYQDNAVCHPCIARAALAKAGGGR